MLSKEQRVSLFNLCTILQLTSYEVTMRQAAQELRELIRKNTFDKQHNECEFDKTVSQKRLEANPIRSASQKYAQS